MEQNNEPQKRGRKTLNLTPEEKREKHRETQRRYREKLKTDPERLQKRKENLKKHLKKYYESDKGKKYLEKRKNDPKFMEYNRQYQQELRKGRTWKEYFNGYFKEWLKNDLNNFTHKCRCSLRYKIKKTQNWIEAQAQGKNADHILTLTNLASFFKSKGILRFEDKKMTRLLVAIANDTNNIRFIKKEKNNKANNASKKKQLEVAKYLELNNPFICDGLTEYLKGAI